MKKKTISTFIIIAMLFIGLVACNSNTELAQEEAPEYEEAIEYEEALSMEEPRVDDESAGLEPVMEEVETKDDEEPDAPSKDGELDAANFEATSQYSVAEKMLLAERMLAATERTFQAYYGEGVDYRPDIDSYIIVYIGDLKDRKGISGGSEVNIPGNPNELSEVYVSVKLL